MIKKKLLLIGHSSLLAGGAEDEFERLLKHFSNMKDRYEIHALFPEGPRSRIFAEYCHSYEIYSPGFFPVTSTKILDYIFFFRLYFKQKKRIKEFVNGKTYDLCLVNVVVLIWPVWFLRKKSKMLLFIRETIEPGFIRKIIYKFLSKYVTHFITVSDVNKEDYIKITQRKNISVLYSSIEESLGIDFTSGDDINCFIQEKNIQKILSKDNFKVVSVGALYDRKNQFLILKSLRILKEANEKIPLLFFIGDTNVDPKYFKEMLNFIQKEKLNEYCYFLGTIEKNIYYKLIGLFNALIISSKSEGLPLVLAEALRFKIPLISTDSGGIKDIIINNYNGILIDNNENELANALSLVQNEKFSDEITDRGFETYKCKFNLDENFRKLDDLCEKIING